MSAVLRPILAEWGSDRRGDPAHILDHYITHPESLACFVARKGAGEIMGFQSLKRAWPHNPYGVEPGWGIIGTYVAENNARQGIGAALFAANRQAAITKGICFIDATIAEANSAAIAYYTAQGFQTYAQKPGAICKCLTLPPVQTP